MKINYERLKDRIVSIAKALSEKLGITVNLSNSGECNTDTESVINIPEPKYYHNLYKGISEQALVNICMYSAIHEAGHIMHTTNGKDVLREILLKKPNFITSKAFNLLNALEDYRMMMQLARHRLGVLSYMREADRIVGNSNAAHLEVRAGNVEAFDYLVIKLYSPSSVDIISPSKLPKADKLTKIHKLIEELKELSKTSEKTEDLIPLVLKYYTTFFSSKVRNLPKEEPKEGPESTSKGSSDNEESTNSSGGNNDDNTSESGNDVTNDNTTNGGDGEDTSSSDSDTTDNDTRSSLEKQIDNEIEEACDSDILESESVKMTKNKMSKTDESKLERKVNRGDIYKNFIECNIDKHTLSILAKGECNIKKFSDIDRKAYTEINCTELHNDYPSVYVELNNKSNNIYKHQHCKPNVTLATRTANKLAGSLESLVKFENDDYITKTNVGVLDNKNLINTSVSSNVFKKRKDSSNGDLCVYFLLDASGSMLMDGDEELVQSAITIHLALKKLEVKHRMLSFFSKSCLYTSDPKGVSNGSMYVNNICEVATNDYMDISMYNGYGNNRDGLAIRWVHNMLMKEPEGNKVLIILSDGVPNCQGYRSSKGSEDTIAAIKQAKADVSVAGMYLNTKGCGDTKLMKRMYGNDYSTVKKSKDIDYAVTNILKRALKNIS